MQPRPEYGELLLNVLLDVPAFCDPVSGLANRTMLLRRLPKRPVTAISRYSSALTDLNSIITHAEGMGQLSDSGEWALVIVTRNSLPFVHDADSRNKLSALMAELDTTGTPASSPIHEIVIGQDERLPINFLERGIEVSRSVAKVLVTRIVNGKKQSGRGSQYSGTGWMIAPGLLMTNHHVIESRNLRFETKAKEEDFKAQAEESEVWFHYNDDGGEHYSYGGWTLVHANRRLDYALLRFTSHSDASGTSLSSWGFLSILQGRAELERGFRLNIIQHPQGGPKLIAIRSNFYFDSYSTTDEPARIRYLTDTEPGSSGSPVFDDNWRVLAMHHAAVPVSEETYRGKVIKYNNQGIIMEAVLREIPNHTAREIEIAQGWANSD